MRWEIKFLAAAVALLGASGEGRRYHGNRLDEDSYGISDEEDFSNDYGSDEQFQKCRQAMDDDVYIGRKKHAHPEYDRYGYHSYHNPEVTRGRPKKYDPDFPGEGRRNKRFAVYRENNVDFYRDPYMRKPDSVEQNFRNRRYDEFPEEADNQFINDINDLYNVEDTSGNFNPPPRPPVSQKSNRYEVYEAPEDEEKSESEIVETKQPYPQDSQDAPDVPYNPYIEPEQRDPQDPRDQRDQQEQRDQRDQQESASGQKNVYKDNYLSQAQYQAARGNKADKGYKSVHQHDERAKGSDLNEKHQRQYTEQGGKKKYSQDGAGHYGQHEEAAQGHKGAKFDEKKGHKKGHKTKGYHNKYHKDEYHKEHRFYDDYHKSGAHHRYGNFNSKHGSNEHGQKKFRHLDSSNHADARGKKGYHNKGHVDENHKGHDNKNGQENRHAYYGNYGKKGSKDGGKYYGFQG